MKKVGKKIGGFTYFHWKYWREFFTKPEWYAIFDIAEEKEFAFEVVKVSKDKKKITLLEVPNFDSDHEPLVTKALTFDENLNTKIRKVNKIYHHKWMMVIEYYEGFSYKTEKKRSEWWEKHFDKARMKIPELSGKYPKAKIGSPEIWEKLLVEMEKIEEFKV